MLWKENIVPNLWLERRRQSFNSGLLHVRLQAQQSHWNLVVEISIHFLWKEAYGDGRLQFILAYQFSRAVYRYHFYLSREN